MFRTLTVRQAAKIGCTVDTLTLSVEQKQLAEKRVKEAGFASQIRVHLMDYRDMPPHFKGAFDACISLEMLEVCEIVQFTQYLLITT
jgi:cyclopropane-fatty-acyl-phospholipid synthase